MKFIETVIELENFYNDIKNKDIAIHSVPRDPRLHPAQNELSFIAVSTRDQTYIIGNRHNELLAVDFEYDKLALASKIWTLDKKQQLHYTPNLELYDVYGLQYIGSNSIIDIESFYTSIQKYYYNIYQHMSNVNDMIPIMKYIEYIDKIISYMWSVIDGYQYLITSNAYTFLNEIEIPTLYTIEKSGIHVDDEKFINKHGSNSKKYIKKSIVHSLYNPYTKTGRPSNKFGKVNFAALNTQDGSRELYTTRYSKGVLISLDYESFHLRLIAELIGYDLPTEIPIHEYFGRQYFEKDILSSEEYAQSKVITFELLYSTKRVDGVPEFFQKVYEYTDAIWNELNAVGYIVSPYSHRRIYKHCIDDCSPSKIFNYLVQLFETEQALSLLHEVFESTQNIVLPVLYTYDSILFDFDMNNSIDEIHNIIDILSKNHQYPIRMYYGQDYQNMTQIPI